MTENKSVKGTFLAPGEGNLYKLMNDMNVKVTADHTGGAYEVCEETCPPGFKSNKHMHTHNHETFYVIEGNVTFILGDETYNATPGSCIHIPPNLPHQVYTKDGARMLMVFSPGTTEAMFSEISTLSQEQLQNSEFMKSVAGKHNTVRVE